MALMLGSLYDALTEAKVPAEKARRAAEEVASYDNRISAVEAKLTLLQWMVGFNIAVSIAILARVFFV